MIVLDASVIVSLGAPGDLHHSRARALMLDSVGACAVHLLNVAEALVGPTRTGREDEALGLLRAMGLTITAPDDDEPRRLARLRVRTGLKLPDCCALSAAVDEGADLATFGRRLATAAERVGVPVVGIE